MTSKPIAAVEQPFCFCCCCYSSLLLLSVRSALSFLVVVVAVVVSWFPFVCLLLLVGKTNEINKKLALHCAACNKFRLLKKIKNN